MTARKLASFVVPVAALGLGVLAGFLTWGRHGEVIYVRQLPDLPPRPSPSTPLPLVQDMFIIDRSPDTEPGSGARTGGLAFNAFGLYVSRPMLLAKGDVVDVTIVADCMITDAAPDAAKNGLVASIERARGGSYGAFDSRTLDKSGGWWVFRATFKSGETRNYSVRILNESGSLHSAQVTVILRK